MTRILEQNIASGTGTGADIGCSSARLEDRHHRRVQGRLVRGLHAAPLDRGLGRVPGRRPAHRYRGGDAPASIWNSFMSVANGSCESSRPIDALELTGQVSDYAPPTPRRRRRRPAPTETAPAPAPEPRAAAHRRVRPGSLRGAADRGRLTEARGRDGPTRPRLRPEARSPWLWAEACRGRGPAHATAPTEHEAPPRSGTAGRPRRWRPATASGSTGESRRERRVLGAEAARCDEGDHGHAEGPAPCRGHVGETRRIRPGAAPRRTRRPPCRPRSRRSHRPRAARRRAKRSGSRAGDRDQLPGSAKSVTGLKTRGWSATRASRHHQQHPVPHRLVLERRHGDHEVGPTRTAAQRARPSSYTMLATQTRRPTPSRSAIITRPTTISAFVGT